MSITRIRIALVALAALFCLASTGIMGPTLAADPQTSPSRKDSPESRVNMHLVGHLRSLPGSVAKLTFAADSKRLAVETDPPPPASPRIRGSGFFLERKPAIRNTVWNLSSNSVAHLKPMAYQRGSSLLSPDVRSLAVWHTEWEAQAPVLGWNMSFTTLPVSVKVLGPKYGNG